MTLSVIVDSLGNELRSSAEWQELIPDLIVRDPDGWDRTNFKESWDELVTLDEYYRRVAQSTCSGDFGAIIRYKRASADACMEGTK